MSIAAAVDQVVYRREIFQFLQTVTLKSSMLLASATATAAAAGYPDDPLRVSDWKYYVNLRGEYHPADIPMTVMSSDTQQMVPFTKDTLATHTRTAQTYRPGRSEYDTLCAKYPTQVDLIKNIVFPVTDIDAAIEADDLTLLTYGGGYLEPYEQDSLVVALQAHLSYLNHRWNLDFLGYELYYAIAYWSMVWQTSAAALYDARIQNIHTTNAHSFHIWEYLTSTGIGDYRDILSRRATLFLYRNMRYILANRGKDSTLTLLVNNLLREAAVGLVGKTIYHETSTGTDECRWIPEIVSDKIPTEYAASLRTIPNETITEMTYRLYQAGVETKTSLEHITQETDTLAATVFNTFPTKVLELAPLSLDKKYANMLNNFILDHLVAMAHQGRVQIPVELVDEYTGLNLRLTTKDALILFYYCQLKTMRQTPSTIPTQYRPKFHYRPIIDIATLPKAVTYRGRFFPVQGAVDVASFCAGVSWPLATIITGTAFEDAMVTMFQALVSQHLTSRQSGSAVVVKAITAIFDAITHQEAYTLSLSDVTTYEDWFARPGFDYRRLLNVYDGASDSMVRYSALADRIIQQLIPITSEVLLRYANVGTRRALYARLKQLFVQLCSYGVTFLDTPRISESWVLDSKITTEMRDGVATTQFDIDVGNRCAIGMDGQHPMTHTHDCHLPNRFGMNGIWPQSHMTSTVTNMRHEGVRPFRYNEYDRPPPMVGVAVTGIQQRIGISTTITLPSP